MQGKLSDKFWTLPNTITLFRLIFGAPITLILYHNGYKYAWVVFFLFALTDWLDGKLSRWRNIGSRWGMRLDPLADQFLNLPMIWMFYWIGNISSLAPVLLTVREALMVLVRLFSNKDIPSQWLGKVKTISEYIAIILLLAGGEWYLLGLIVLFPVMFFALISFLKYLFDVFLSREGGMRPC